MVNNELIAKGELLPVMEEFYSIQGEGANTGKPAYFLRIGGCDVGCAWCDVKESWNPEWHPLTMVDEIIERILDFPAKAVVITGGEPLMYNLTYLCAQLKKNGIQTFLETSGSYPISGEWDWVCLSPKKNSPPEHAIYNKADELKVIIHDESDFEWAETHLWDLNPNCRLYLQPEWSHFSAMLPLIIDYVLAHPKWMISLQSHKFMNIP